jgi:hypothetical protein
MRISPTVLYPTAFVVAVRTLILILNQHDLKLAISRSEINEQNTRLHRLSFLCRDVSSTVLEFGRLKALAGPIQR